MGKKLLIVAIAVVAVAVVLKKTDLGSHVSLCWRHAKDDIKKEVSPEWEIDRLRMEIDSLAKEEKKHISAMAEESVAVDTLEKDIERMKENMAAQWMRVEKMTADLESGSEYITYGNERYSATRVKSMLTREFNAYKDAEKGLKGKEAMLKERKKSLEQAQEELFAMRDARREMEDDLVNIEAELKALRVAQTRSKFSQDDSKLSKVKEGVGNLKSRVAVEKKKLDYQAEFSHGAAPVIEKKEKKDILSEVREYKSANGKAVEKTQK